MFFSGFQFNMKTEYSFPVSLFISKFQRGHTDLFAIPVPQISAIAVQNNVFDCSQSLPIGLFFSYIIYYTYDYKRFPFFTTRKQKSFTSFIILQVIFLSSNHPGHG